MARIRHSLRLFAEFVGLARETRSYWIIPLILLLGLYGILFCLGQSWFLGGFVHDLLRRFSQLLVRDGGSDVRRLFLWCLWNIIHLVSRHII